MYLFCNVLCLIHLAPAGEHDDDDGAIPGAKVKGVMDLPGKAETASEEFKVVQEFINACIPQYSIISVPHYADPDVPISVFQVLSQRTKLKNVATYAMVHATHQIRWNVQPYDIHHGALLMGKPLPASIDVFRTFDPIDVDILGFLRDPMADCEKSLSGRGLNQIWRVASASIEQNP